eukprot:3421193-Rhodomonas_salina.1
MASRSCASFSSALLCPATLPASLPPVPHTLEHRTVKRCAAGPNTRDWNGRVRKSGSLAQGKAVGKPLEDRKRSRRAG